jgi:hypothetical protein
MAEFGYFYRIFEENEELVGKNDGIQWKSRKNEKTREIRLEFPFLPSLIPFKSSQASYKLPNY